MPFVRGNSLFLNILKVLFQRDIIADIIITDLVNTENKDRKTISNECYEIIKEKIENNVS